ncbi:hypothetical protein, partial [Psychroflexus maritimus]
ANVQAFEQTIYAFFEDEETGCTQIFDLDLFTRNTPQTETPEPLTLCDDNETGVRTFDLSLVEDEVLQNVENTDELII